MTFALLAFSAHMALADTPIAKVGGRVITLEELNRTLGSLPTAEHLAADQALEKNARALEALRGMIDAQLLYDEAAASGVMESKEFIAKSAEYREITLAGLYRRKIFDEKAKVGPAQIEKLSKEKGLNAEAAAAMLQGKKRNEAIGAEGARLYDKYRVEFSPDIAALEPSKLKNTALLVKSSIFAIGYGEVRDKAARVGPGKKDLLEYLAGVVEEKLFAAEGKEAGLDKSPRFKELVAEFDLSLAVNIYRDKVNKKNEPSKKDISKYIADNDYLKFQPRRATALLIVTQTKEQAEDVRKKAIEGANFHELAIEFSVAPDAKSNAGRIGVLTIGDRPYTSIDKALLSVKPGGITVPVQGLRGYSVFKLLEITKKEKRNDKEASPMARQTILEERFEKIMDALRKSGKVELLYSGQSAAK
ncbi:MAG: peptidylprolyl isomerase [Nitrospinae bacterium]|nr:peptidylprolyl isomerase [Nitrospinota bacterium]